MTVTDLKKRARELNIPGRSSMGRTELEAALSPVVVFRQDCRLMAHLRQTVGQEPWFQFGVYEWEERGRGRFRSSRPRAWNVPAGLLIGLTPIGQQQADEARGRRSTAAKAATHRAAVRVAEMAEGIGIDGRGRLAKWFAGGQVDEYEARLIDFRIRFRHDHTDYDTLLAGGEVQKFARSDARPTAAAPQTWDEYLARYGFDGDAAAIALAGILKDPRQAHPVWFCEAVEAAKKFDIPTEELNYERVRAAVERWRDERFQR